MCLLLSHVQEGEGNGRYLRALGIRANTPAAFWFSDLDRALDWVEDRMPERDRFEDAPEPGLRDTAFFAGLEENEMATLGTLLQRQELDHGDVLFREGDAADRVYLIARGSVSIKVQLSGENRARRLATFVLGVFFGEMTVLEDGCRSVDAFAKGSQVVLYSLRAEDLAGILRDHAQLGIKPYRNLGRELTTRLCITSGALPAPE